MRDALSQAPAHLYYIPIPNGLVSEAAKLLIEPWQLGTVVLVYNFALFELAVDADRFAQRLGAALPTGRRELAPA